MRVPASASAEHTGPTSGLAPGYAQANLVILPADDALDFARFCVRNPKPCPLLEVTDTGSPNPPRSRADADLRTDLPRYRVFSDGALVDEPTDVTRYWRDDLVSFLLGCSFTFEWALAAAGLPLAHQRQGVNVPMYVTDRRCVGAGPFEGPLVVSMRPVRAGRHRARRRDHLALPGDAWRARPYRRSRRARHHRSRRARLRRSGDGRTAVRCRCSGRAVSHHRRSCIEARPSLAIFHAPGHMFITDRPHAEFDSARRRAMTVHDEQVSPRHARSHRLSEKRCGARRSATPSSGSTSRSTASSPPTSPTSSSRPATTPSRCSTPSRSSRRPSSCDRSAGSSSDRWPIGSAVSACWRS